MDVILKEDVEKLGFKNEIVKVKNGFGRNFLIPKGLAVLATKSAIKSIYSKYPVFTQSISLFFSSSERLPLGGIR